MVALHILYIKNFWYHTHHLLQAIFANFTFLGFIIVEHQTVVGTTHKVVIAFKYTVSVVNSAKQNMFIVKRVTWVS